MNPTSICKGILALLFISTALIAQQPRQEINVAPTAPQDRVVHATNNEAQQFEDAIKPYVELARKTYPEAKQRFLKGLPPKQSFFITTRLYNAARQFEQVFVAVREIKDGQVTGLIWSDVGHIPGFKKGDSYSFPESEIYDWTISRPDGSEEGNVVGKFLDTYQPSAAGETQIWRKQPATPERISQTIVEAADKYAGSGPIPRGILYDIAYPRDAAEYAALDGHALLLLTAVDQNRDELPLKRVYVSIAGKEIELKSIKCVLSEPSDPNSQVTKTFGAFRADALYLLPVYLRLQQGTLMADFGQNKIGYKLTAFGGPVSSDVGSLPIKAPTGNGPPDKVLEDFIRREYPRFFN